MINFLVYFSLSIDIDFFQN
uniref:Uncharacterized protein n=1 Tax=Romanomermis culicivorax TaxID=13658 RepID=A0A915IIB6_ROMCU